MTHGSLFSGIGGFDLAAEWMGWENKFHCEWNPFGQKVLKYYWPEAESFDDITKTDFTKYANTIDILTGGFPCQPYSLAGKRKGKEDDRHLWPEMCRAIREIKPRWVVGENVLGLVNWNGGLVFHEVQSDLEAEGYEVWPFVLPAASVNAPHRRDRVWFVAYSKSLGWRGRWSETCNKRENIIQQSRSEGFSTRWITTDTDNNGLNECHSSNEINTGEGRINAFNDINKVIMQSNGTSKQRKHIRQKRKGKFNRPDCGYGFNDFQNFPTVSPICDGNDGISDRLDGITFSKWRNESIKAGGNAIVPQVVYQIFKSIEIYDRNH